jgi:MraZ protein
MTHKAARSYSRVFFASAHDEVPDKQGRVSIPSHLREYAGLDRDVVVIGASSRVEIWDTAAWETYLAESEDDFSGIEEGVLPGGL